MCTARARNRELPWWRRFGDPAFSGIARSIRSHLENGLLALLDVLHQLDGRCVPLAHVIANFLGGAVLAIQHFPVLRVQSDLTLRMVFLRCSMFFINWMADVYRSRT